MKELRRLADLVSVGPATVADLERLGIRTVADLARCEPEDLYRSLCERDSVRHDPCTLDVFSAAVAQARDPDLPYEEKLWWTWSRRRKQGVTGGNASARRRPEARQKP